MNGRMHRRSFLTLLGTSAAAWPLAARAQQPQRIRRVGMLVAGAENDSSVQRRIDAFRKLLGQLGWTEGRNLQLDYRFVDLANPEQVRRNGAELIASTPDVIVTNSTPSVAALQSTTRTIPIVFAGANDPVGSGIVESFARPGGNTTGFANTEFSTSGKYLELLKEIAPGVTRAMILRDPTSPAGVGNFAAIQAAATSLQMEVRPLDNRSAAVIEQGITAFAGFPSGGMVLPPSVTSLRHRDLIIRLAGHHKLPTVYTSRVWVDDGGLLSYAPDVNSSWRGAASYVDRILKGEKPADLPVQLPVKYETLLNMKTAKALGLNVPTSILLRADEVLE